MAMFKWLTSMNIGCAKKVLVALLITMIIALFFMDAISIKIDISNVHKFLKDRVYSGKSENGSLDTTAPKKTVVPTLNQSKNQILDSAGLKNSSQSGNEKSSTLIKKKQTRYKSQSGLGDNLQNFGVKLKNTIQKQIQRTLSAENFYKDPRNILPSELDLLKASNVSWVSFLSPSDKENVYEEYAKMGIESTELHSFKSPYIVDPRIHRAPKEFNRIGTKVKETSQIKKKIISCYACEAWMEKAPSMTYNRDFKMCPFCEFDFKGKLVSKAEAVIFFPLVLGGRPVPRRPMGQIWIMAQWESPVHFQYPKSYQQWKSVFNWTFTYRTDSDIFAPNNLFAWRKRDLLLSDEEYLSIAKQKTKTAAWFVSHCETQSRRKEYVKKLQKYIDVDIYGKCGTKSCRQNIGNECEKMLTTTYKFYLSFENSFCKDYVTEKLFRSIADRTHVIPVTRGGFENKKYIPPGGYVDAADFESPEELGMFLKKLGNDVTSYAEILKEKDKLVGLNFKLDWCSVCEKLHTRSPSETKTIPDIKYWSHQDKCYPPPGWKKFY